MVFAYFHRFLNVSPRQSALPGAADLSLWPGEEHPETSCHLFGAGSLWRLRSKSQYQIWTPHLFCCDPWLLILSLITGFCYWFSFVWHPCGMRCSFSSCFSPFALLSCVIPFKHVVHYKDNHWVELKHRTHKLVVPAGLTTAEIVVPKVSATTWTDFAMSPQ